MAAIPEPRRRSGAPLKWAGALGMLLGTTLGAAACYALVSLL